MKSLLTMFWKSNRGNPVLRLAGVVLLIGALLALVVQPALADPTPTGANVNAVGISLSQQLYDSTGTTLLGNLPPTLAAIGDQVQYTITLYVPSPPQIPLGDIATDYFGGDLHFTDPHGTVQTLSPITPTVSNPVSATPLNVFTWVVPNKYVIAAGDKGGSGYWTAFADYGETTRFPSANFGTYMSDPEQETASATTSATFASPGQLTVTKAVSLGSVVNPTGINDTFTVNVTGPSYPSPGTNLTFTVTNGVPSAPQTLSNLILGTYTVSETPPVDGDWTASGGGGVTLTVLNPSGSSTVTNTYVPGSLTITKSVVNGAGLTQDFVVTVVGPSYPSPGTSYTFHLISGTVTNSPWVLPNLIPGSYTVTESNPGASWQVTGTGGVTVSPGAPGATKTVTNTYSPGSLNVAKLAVLGTVVNPSGISQDFTVTVVGPSYPSPGTSYTFHLVNGNITNSPWILSNLTPGTYTVSETDPGPDWTVSGTGGVSVTGGSSPTATVTNTYGTGWLTVNKSVVGAGNLTQDFTVTVVGPSYPSPGTSYTFHLVSGTVTNSPWTLYNLIPGSYTVTEAAPGTYWTASGGGGVTVFAGAGSTSTVTNTYASPHTTLTMTSSVSQLPIGGGDVVLTITDTNDGQLPLVGPSSPPPNSPYVILTGAPFIPSPITLDDTYPTFTRNMGSGDTMGTNEQWTWVVTINNVTAATSFLAVGHGFANGIDVTYPNYPEQYGVSVSLPPPVPASSNLGIGLMIAIFALGLVFFGWQRTRRSQKSS